MLVAYCSLLSPSMFTVVGACSLTLHHTGSIAFIVVDIFFLVDTEK